MQIRTTARALLSVSLPALLTGWGSFAAPAGAASAVSPLPASDYVTRPLCAEPLPGSAGCLAVELVPRTAAARAHTHPLALTRTRPLAEPTPAEGAYGFRPSDLHIGYQLPTLQLEAQTNPQTIGIVDAYDDAHAEADLKVYDEEFGLPECTHANGCFTKVNQNGQSATEFLPDSESEAAKGWAGEIATDVEVAHAVCQDCRILLVEATSAAFSNLDIAENRAVAMGATEISDSWGGPEALGESNTAFEHPGTVITAAAGDTGYLDWNNEASERGAADFPATSPNVIAVGGTRLNLHTVGDTWKEESVWNGDGASGGGCSTIFTAQKWQPSATVGCGANRAVADVAADGDPYTGVAVYDSTPDPATENSVGWGTIGGTSVASPIVASIFALAGGFHGIAEPAETLYANLTTPGALHDITTGSNGACGKSFNVSNGTSGCTIAEEAAACSGAAICKAATGYDGPSGVGTPIGLGAFQPTNGQLHIGETDAEREATREREATGNPAGQEHGTPGSETHGGTNGGAAQGTASSGSSTATGPATTASPSRVSLSGLALTLNAISALNHPHPKTSRIGFAFTLNLAAKVRVALARQVRVHGHARWSITPGSFTIAARAGRNRIHLKAKRRLAAGRYLLTCSPAQGAAQSLVLVLG